jgi:hypothetical protein
MNENGLMQKLMISKKIMDKHNEIPRSNSGGVNLNAPIVEEYNAPSAKYNIPQEYSSEPAYITQPRQNPQVNSQEKILSSKLPDAIKKLMIEHPIVQPQQKSLELSDDLIEKASRLMGANRMNVPQQNVTTESKQKQSGSTMDNTDLKKLLRETVKEVLMENGLLTESVEKSNDAFAFRVGRHIFEGRVTKIRKAKG